MDPEARPPICQLIDAMHAIGGGGPLPDMPLTEEAQACRRARLDRQTTLLMPVKTKKPVVVALPPRPTGPLDPNSVAARRLNAKKGGSTAGFGFPSEGTKHAGNESLLDLLADKEHNFDAFASSSHDPHHENTTAAVPSSQPAFVASFDMTGFDSTWGQDVPSKSVSREADFSWDNSHYGFPTFESTSTGHPPMISLGLSPYRKEPVI